jgi:hypothetical protein
MHKFILFRKSNSLTCWSSSFVTRRSSRWYRDVVKLYGSWTVTIVAKLFKNLFLDLCWIMYLLGCVWRSRKGSSGRGNLATRCARTFSNSSAAFLYGLRGVRINRKSKQTDEEYEDFVHFHFAFYQHEVYRLLDDLVLSLLHHYLMFLLTILVHNQAN